MGEIDAAYTNITIIPPMKIKAIDKLNHLWHKNQENNLKEIAIIIKARANIKGLWEKTLIDNVIRKIKMLKYILVMLMTHGIRCDYW